MGQSSSAPSAPAPCHLGTFSGTVLRPRHSLRGGRTVVYIWSLRLLTFPHDLRPQ